MSTALCPVAPATKVYKTDWLGSRPVFYHERTGRVSHNVNDVIDLLNVELDAAGLRLFLRFGYSVFGRTPVRHVRFLPPCSRLTVQREGRLSIDALPDPVEAWLGRTTREVDVLAALQAAVQDWERRVDGDLIVPTSGGFDSRLLNLLVRDRRRIRAFTYGLSSRQEQCREVVHARALAQRLGTRWQQIRLGQFHRYLDEWDTLFGVSTHAHGMYHLEFYHRVAEFRPGPAPLLTGIIGDAWAGNVNVPEIASPADLITLGHTHGAHADETICLLRGGDEPAEAYYDQHRTGLRDPRIRIVEAMRLKLILLTYLLRVPEHVGYQPWSPFLEPDLALAMLTLPPERRADRRWQRDFFARHGVDLEAANLPADRRNTLNQQALRRVPLPPLDDRLLREIVWPEYVRWINSTVGQYGVLWNGFWELVRHRRWGRPLRRRRVRDRRFDAYFAYLTLRPLETLLRQRDDARRGAT